MGKTHRLLDSILQYAYLGWNPGLQGGKKRAGSSRSWVLSSTWLLGIFCSSVLSTCVYSVRIWFILVPISVYIRNNIIHPHNYNIIYHDINILLIHVSTWRYTPLFRLVIQHSALKPRTQSNRNIEQIIMWTWTAAHGILQAQQKDRAWTNRDWL